MMLEVSFTVIFRPDTEAPDEALEEAQGMMQMIRESWYGGVSFASDVRVTVLDEDGSSTGGGRIRLAAQQPTPQEGGES